MHKTICTLLLVAMTTGQPGWGHEAPRYRTAINLPDISGYVTLKCDFHIHTVFSDGLVWPTVRSEEAWREGLDAIAITDHIEYQPHQADMIKNHNRAYELARGTGDNLRVMVIQGSEITRGMPPGHLNAIFITNATPLETDLWQDAINEAHRQGAFIFWNHPGWDRQLTNGQVVWYAEHTELLAAGKLHGIEVVNDRDYYPEAHRWALEKNLTLLSNSDIHQPVNLDYQVHAGDHRPLTLVFATERSEAALKEALFARRTVVYSGHRLIGKPEFLAPIFANSITVDRPAITLKNRVTTLLQIRNTSDVTFELEAAGTPAGCRAPAKIKLVAGRTVLFEVRAHNNATVTKEAPVFEYRVKNLLVAPDEPLVVKLPIQVTFE